MWYYGGVENLYFEQKKKRRILTMDSFSKNQSKPWYEVIEQQILDNAKAHDTGKSATFQAVDIPDGYIYTQRVIIPTGETWKSQRCSIDPQSMNCRVCGFNFECNRYNSAWE